MAQNSNLRLLGRSRNAGTSELSWDHHYGATEMNRRVSTSVGAGLAFRRATRGAESDLLDEFLARFPYPTPANCRVTVFREPRLPSGFPDAVVVVWNPEVAVAWEEQRSALNASDLRLMQLLVGAGPTTNETLLSLAGRRPTSSLDRLEAAGLIWIDKAKRWRVYPLREVFAVRDIIAVEAKMTEWSGAVEQATRNTWFASRSYVLLPQLPKNREVLVRAAAQGVGLWTLPAGAPVRELGARRGPLPRSYASWLFNEWVWRFAFELDESLSRGTIGSTRTILGESL